MALPVVCNSDLLGELLLPLQVHTGPVPGSVNATNKFSVHRGLVPPKGLSPKADQVSYHMLGRDTEGETQRWTVVGRSVPVLLICNLEYLFP